MERVCIWNYLDKTICGKPRHPDSWLWCEYHKTESDKIWVHRDPRSVAYEESKKPKIIEVQLPDTPGESYL